MGARPRTAHLVNKDHESIVSAIEADIAKHDEKRRRAALVETARFIGKIPVRAMNVVDYLILSDAGNAHFAKHLAPSERAESAVFWASHDEALIWLQSLEFSRAPTARERFFHQVLGPASWPETHPAVLAYLDEMLAGAPDDMESVVNGRGVVAGVCFAAQWIFEIAEATHFSRAEIRAMALPEFFQFLRAARARREETRSRLTVNNRN